MTPFQLFSGFSHVNNNNNNNSGCSEMFFFVSRDENILNLFTKAVNADDRYCVNGVLIGQKDAITKERKRAKTLSMLM
jgi:hypothetical protein